MEQLKRIFGMNLTVSTLWQVLTVLLEIANAMQHYTSGDTKVYVGAFIGIGTILLHVHAGKTNPDGTPAEVAYIPASKDKKDG